MAMALLGNKCNACKTEYNGKNAPIFEFDHVDPSLKEAQIMRIITSRKWSEVVVELNKCRLMCANCHNLRHGGEW
jgi:hypothetical protein